jgi:uncharacterized protein with beta-barrel porin domain
MRYYQRLKKESFTEPKTNMALTDGSTTTDEIKACFAVRIKKRPIIQQTVEKHMNIMAGHHVRTCD